MRSETGYVFTDSDLHEKSEREANRIKDVLCTHFEQFGLMPKATEWAQSHAVVLIRKGHFGRLIEQWLGLESETHIQIVELQRIEESK